MGPARLVRWVDVVAEATTPLGRRGTRSNEQPIDRAGQSPLVKRAMKSIHPPARRGRFSDHVPGPGARRAPIDRAKWSVIGGLAPVAREEKLDSLHRLFTMGDALRAAKTLAGLTHPAERRLAAERARNRTTVSDTMRTP